MADSTTRPKTVRTYGSRRAEPEAATSSAPVQKLTEVIMSKSVRSPSPTMTETATPSPSKESSSAIIDDYSSSDFFGWRNKLRDIDEGLEDDNLKDPIGKNTGRDASASLTRTSSPKLAPPPPPLFSDTAPSTPTSPSPKQNSKATRLHSLSPLPGRTSLHSESDSGSSSPPTRARRQIYTLSISSPPDHHSTGQRRSRARSLLIQKNAHGDREDESDEAPTTSTAKASGASKKRSQKTKVNSSFIM